MSDNVKGIVGLVIGLVCMVSLLVWVVDRAQQLSPEGAAEIHCPETVVEYRESMLSRVSPRFEVPLCEDVIHMGGKVIKYRDGENSNWYMTWHCIDGVPKVQVHYTPLILRPTMQQSRTR